MIILQYGLPKSGSTFLAQLLVAATDTDGISQESVRERIFPDKKKALRGYWNGKLIGLGGILEQLRPGERLVIKTHAPLTVEVRKLVGEGKIVPIISCRHPGDAALSVYEAGQKAIRDGDFSQGFRNHDTHDKAIDFVSNHLNRITMHWLKAYPENVFLYEKMTKEPEWTKRRIEALVGFPQNSLEQSKMIKDLITGRRKVYNFNEGKAGRSAAEFSQEATDRISLQCADYMKAIGYA